MLSSILCSVRRNFRMVKTFVQSIRGSFIGMAIVCLFVFALTLAACSGATTTTSPSSPTTNNTGASSSDTARSALVVRIKEASKNRYTLYPASFTVKKGDSVILLNQTTDDKDFYSGDATK